MSRSGLVIAMVGVAALVAIAAGVAFFVESAPSAPTTTDAGPVAAIPSGESRPVAVSGDLEAMPVARAEAAIDDDPLDSAKLDQSLFEIVGRIVGSDGKPLAKANVRVYVAPMPLLSTAVVDVVRNNGMKVEEYTKTTSSDGKFRLRGPFSDANDYLLLAKARDAAPLSKRGFVVERGATCDLGDLRLESGYEVKGRVLDPSGNPVQAARVTAIATPNWLAIDRYLESVEPEDLAPTDDHGEFTIPHLADGRYTVVAWAKGLARGAAPPIILTKEKPPTPLEINLAPGAAISGSVVGAEGAAVVGAKVKLRFRKLEEWDPNSGTLVGEDSLLCDYPVTVTTDAAGRFEAEGLVADKEYRLTASADGYRKSEDNRYFAKAGRTGVTISLRPEFEIRGTVVDAETGAPIGGATVARFNGRPEELRRGIWGFPKGEGATDSQGKFVARDAERPGRCMVVAWFPNIGGAAVPSSYAPALSEPFEIAEGKEIPAVTIKMEKGAKIAGVVISAATGEPLSGAALTLYSTQDPKVPNFRQYAMGAFTARASSGAAGTFLFDGLIPGFYLVEVRHAVAGGARCEIFELAKGDRREGVRITVPIPGAIRGTVLTHGSIGSIRVTAVRLDGLAFATFADAECRFAFPKIPPGLYRVRADKLASYDEAGYGRGFRFGGGASDGTVTLDVRDGQTQEVALEIPDSNLGRLVGLVVDENGPGSGYAVVLVREALNDGRPVSRDGGTPAFSNYRWATADVDGSYEFPTVKEGNYRVYAVPRGRGLTPKNCIASEPIQVFGNATARRDLFGRSGPVRGKVLRPTGQGLGGVSVVATVNGTRSPASALAAGSRFTARSRGDGSFDFGRLPGGAYDLSVESGGYPKKTVGFEVYGSNTDTVTIQLENPRPRGDLKPGVRTK